VCGFRSVTERALAYHRWEVRKRPVDDTELDPLEQAEKYEWGQDGIKVVRLASGRTWGMRIGTEGLQVTAERSAACGTDQAVDFPAGADLNSYKLRPGSSSPD
jgi:hypothetical protein